MSTPNLSRSDLDERTLAFLAIVDCDPSEVRDIPPGRANAVHGQSYDAMEDAMGQELDPPKRDLSSVVLYFGKHKGKKLEDIPCDYLLWLVQQPPLDTAASQTRRSLEKTKRLICEYLDIPVKTAQVDTSKFPPMKVVPKKKKHKRHKAKKKPKGRTTTQDQYWTKKPTKVWRPRHP